MSEDSPFPKSKMAQPKYPVDSNGGLSFIDQSDYKRCKYIIQSGLEAMVKSLEVVRDRRLYREEYETFEQFCRVEFGKSRSYVNRLITMSQVNENLLLNDPFGSEPIQNPVKKEVALALSEVPFDEQPSVLKAAVEGSVNGQPTAKLVKEIIEKRHPSARKTTIEKTTQVFSGRASLSDLPSLFDKAVADLDGEMFKIVIYKVDKA